MSLWTPSLLSRFGRTSSLLPKVAVPLCRFSTGLSPVQRPAIASSIRPLPAARGAVPLYPVSKTLGLTGSRTLVTSEAAQPAFHHGKISFHKGTQRPHLTLPLPSQSSSIPMTVALQFSQPLASVVTQIQQDFPEIKRISFYSLTSDGKNLHSRFSSSTLVREMLSTVSQSETKGFRIELDNFNVLVALPTLLERVEPLKHELAFVEKKIEEMNVVKDHCDKIAHRYSESVLRLSFGGLLVYWVVGIRLTWWELGWDVMEPFTYFCGIGFALATYVWYMLTRQEYTYDSLKSLSQNIKLKEIYRQRGFDATEYEHHVKRAEKLTHLIAEIRAEYGEDAIDELRDHHLAKKNV